MTAAKEYRTEQIRNVAVLGHGGSGKTTLVDALCFVAGSSRRHGNVREGTALTMYTPEEISHGISMQVALAFAEWEGVKINLLDTPGHQDFSEDTYRVLTAVDAALMVIDSVNGVEAQTIRLLEVCRARSTPIITFINKLDREGKEPLEVLDEIERVLGMPTVPFTFPVGMGKRFGGVFDIRGDRMRVFKPGEDRAGGDVEVIEGIGNPATEERFGEEFRHARDNIELLAGASEGFDRDAFLSGEQTPVFFGSAINNFGVQEVLDALVELAPSPGPKASRQRVVEPTEDKFTGVVFKIQANMDPAHRDRVAFVRVCSGRFERGMSLKLSRTGKDVKTANAVSFLSQRREILEDAYPGDIIGLPNRGVLQLGVALRGGLVGLLAGLLQQALEVLGIEGHGSYSATGFCDQ